MGMTREKLPRSFIVRLWAQPKVFVAEVRPLAGGQNHSFETLEQLFAFFRAQAGHEDRS